MVIVTGGSGHIGNVVVRTLLKKGYKVGIIDKDAQRDPSVEGLDIEYFQGDIRDKEFLIKTFSQAEYVIHLAAILSMVPGREDLIYSVNVEGTKNVCEACLENNVKKLIYTSSIHALYNPKTGVPSTEKLANPKNIPDAYGKSKVFATIEIKKAIEKGLDATIVYPTGVLGPYNFKMSDMKGFTKTMFEGGSSFYIDGGFNFVDVRDVANGIVLAMEENDKEGNYILSGTSISIYDLMTTIAKITKGKKPSIKIPTFLIRFIVKISELISQITHKESAITSSFLDMINSNYLVSSKKAEKELGYTHRNIEETLRDTIKWMKDKRI
jgi:dihydroflavonol-4-reductase